jgi:Phage integrase, N-terminal SAM-like domain
MTTATPSTALATIQPVFTDPERLALAGYLAGYRGLTRSAYALDLRQFTTWCRARSLPLFAVRRADIESFARDLETKGRARATVTRRLCTIAGFYRYAVEEELLEHSPGDRPSHRRAHRRAGVPGPRRAAAGPARRRADRPQDRTPRPDRQIRHAPHAETCLHHHHPGCRGAIAGCARGGVTCGPRTTIRYDRARGSLDRHATYIVAAYVAGAAR